MQIETSHRRRRRNVAKLQTQPIAKTDYTVKEIAAKLQIAVISVRKLIRSGKLKHYKISERGTRVTQSQLDEFRNVA